MVVDRDGCIIAGRRAVPLASRLRGRSSWALALLAFVALGAWCGQVRVARPPLPEAGRFLSGEPVEVIAHVSHDGVLRGRVPWQRQSVDLETEQIRAGGTVTNVSIGLRVTVYARPHAADAEDADDQATPALPHVFVYGQRLRFPVELRQPRNFRNPGAWDYRGYLAKQGIVATGSVDAASIELLPGTAGTRFGMWRSRARRSVLKQIHALWPSEQAALFDAMLIGERSFLARDTSTAWQRTGIYHILVVSGMNVGLLALPVFWLLRRARAGALVATVLTLLLASAYAYLAESGTPILRAVLMLAVFLVARLFYRERQLLNAVGAAALALLVADPQALFDPSFQLTFISVLAIAGLGVPMLERTSEPYRRGMRWLLLPAYDLSLAPRVVQLRLDLRLLAERLVRLTPLPPAFALRALAASFVLAGRLCLLFYEVCVVSALAQLAMALPMAFYFHRAVVVGLPANILAVPLTSVLMPASAAALALAYVWMPLAKLPALLAGWSLSLITAAVDVMGKLRLADVRLATPTLWVSLAVAASVVLAFVLIRRRAWLAGAGVVALVLAVVWLSAVAPQPQLRPGVLEVTAIDVGQAESLFVVTPTGRVLLVDAAGAIGPWQSEFDFGEDVIAPYLWTRRLTRVDAIVLTHAHADHMGGMASLIAAFRPRELWLGPNADTPALQQLRRTATAHNVQLVERRAGERFDYGGSEIEVLAPPPGWLPAAKTRNNDSLVLRLSFGATSALLTADADKKIESYLAGLGKRAGLLKVGHNGSATSTTAELLRTMQPEFAAISVGAHNRFGHPRPEVLQRLAQARVRTFRTDIMGATSFFLNGKMIEAKPAVLR